MESDKKKKKTLSLFYDQCKTYYFNVYVLQQRISLFLELSTETEIL